MRDDNKRELTPRLRFPEFREAAGWQEALLGNVARLVNDRIRISEVPLDHYVSTENLLPDYAGVGSASKLPEIDSVIQYQAGDVLVSNIRPYLKKVWYSNRSGGASNDVLVIRARDSLLSDYLSYLLRNDAFIAFVMSGAKGVKMPRGDIATIKGYPLAYPSPAEQQKIADCLSSVDELITAQTQKLEALKTHKKGLMQNLFPREGETIPRYRFPEFQDAPPWEARELGTMTTKVGSGITPTGGDKNYKTNGRPFVRSQNVGWGELILDDVAFIDEETHTSFDSTEIKAFDVLLNITGASIGRSAVADHRIAGGNVNQHVCIIRVRPSELMPVLLNQYLISEYGQKQIESFQAGGNRQGLNFAQIRSFQIPIAPTIEEQRLVANSLSTLDDLIATQSQKLEALKTHKKGLMQQLFPSMEAVEA